MNVTYLYNLMKPQTGTLVGSKYCADVNVEGGSISVVGITGVGVKTTRYHDCASVGINGNAGAFVALGSGAALAQDISKIQLTSTIGEPLTIRVGVDAAAAAAASDLIVLNRGDGPVNLDVTIPSGSLLWIRSLTTVAIADGLLTANLMG